MALLVEDGTGVAGAESYFAIAAADAYWAARPQDPLAETWADAELTAKEGAAREGSGYLDATWGELYRGARLTAAQGRLWPRIDRTYTELNARYPTPEALAAIQAATDRPLLGADGLRIAALPSQVVEAAIELAARALTTRLAPDVDPSTPWIKREKVGPIETEYGGAGPGTPGGSYGFVDTMLAPVLIGVRNATWNWA